MTNLFDPQTLSRLERLDLVAKTVVEGFFSGRHASPYRGFSSEFMQHRQYTPGDDTRRIDWKAYGRTERYYLREHRQETNLTAHVLVDTSRSMAYASGQLRKLEYAKMAAACLAYLVLDQQDSVAVMTFDGDVKMLSAPTSRMDAFVDVCEALAPVEPRGDGDIARALHTVAEAVSRRGVIVVISDFLEKADAVVKGIEHIVFEGHDCLVIQVLDPAERAFPFSGYCLFDGLEGGKKVITDAARVKARYLSAMEAFLAELRTGAVAAGADYLYAVTSEGLDKVLAAYLLSREGRR